jgi:hypothetical protein
VPADYVKSAQGNTTAREYRRSWQRTRILLISSSRLALTVLLCASCTLVLRHYQDKGDLTTKDAQRLNAWMTALPLFVALNFRSSLQSYVKILKWWILARWDWPVCQFDLIQDITSSKTVLQLMWQSRKIRSLSPSRTQWACVVWLLANVAGSVCISLLSLAYNMDSSEGIGIRSGFVTKTDMWNRPP